MDGGAERPNQEVFPADNMKTELLDVAYYQGIGVYFGVVSLLALVLNGSAVAIFLTNQPLLVPSNYLLLSMAVSDFLRSFVVLPVAAYANYQHWWTVDEIICQYFAFASSLLGLSSMIHLVALAFHRWITIKTAITQDVSERKMAGLVAGMWLYSLIWSICPLLGWSSFGPEPGYAGCSINWHSPAPGDQAFIMSLFMFFFFLPIVSATFCYISIYVEISKMAKNAAKRWGSVALPTQETVQAKSKAVKMSLVMVIAFLVAWCPYAVVSMYSSFTASSVSPLLSTLPTLFAKLSICYNPIIFFTMYSRFRRAGKQMFTKFFVTFSPIVRRQRAVVLPVQRSQDLLEANKSGLQIQRNPIEHLNTDV